MSAPPVAHRPIPWLRLVVAWAITFGALPYLWGRTLTWTLLVGRPEWRITAITAVVVLGLMVLSWGARTPARGVGVFLGWLIANAVLIGLYAVPKMPLWQLLTVFIASTIWVVWLAWLGAWPFRRGVTFALLAVWLGLGVLGPYLVRVEGMMGDTGLIFAWRHKPDANIPPLAAAQTADLTPSPSDFPQYLGPDRTAVLPRVKVAGDWTAAPPREVWRRPVGQGWGSFAVVGNAVFTQEQRGPNECVACYRLNDGAPLWVHSDAARFEGLGGVGPSATPTVADGRVYALGNTGILNCLDGATGKRVWTTNILADVKATRVAGHGTCTSPLVDGNRVIVCPTGAGGPCLAVYDRATGAQLWSTGTVQASYSSPVIVEIAGRRQILLATSAGLAGHEVGDGLALWQFAWTNNEGINASQPIVLGPDQVFLSTGYGKGSVVVRVTAGTAGIAGWSAEAVRECPRLMKTKFTTPVLFRDHVYGLDDGILACLDPQTGKLKWKDGRYGHGQVLLAGDRLIVQAENGDVALVEPSPDKRIERGRVKALTGRTWNNPVLAGRYLLVRNDHEAACYEVPAGD